jgi:predicted Zn finger-like uncharacterized protein
MIITCEKCATRFRLDESLLKTDGSKVRCSLCKHIFTAFPPLPDAGLDPETGSLSPDDSQADDFQADDFQADDIQADDIQADDIQFDTREDIPAEPGDTPPEAGDATAEPGDAPPEPGDATAEPGDTPPEPGDAPRVPGHTTVEPGESQTDDFEDSLDFEETDFEEELHQEADIEISFEDEDTGIDMETGISFDADDENQIDFDSDDLELETLDPDDLELEALDPGDLEPGGDPDEPDPLSGLEMDLASDALEEEISVGISDLPGDPDAAQQTVLEKEFRFEKTEDAGTESEFDLTFDLDESNQPVDEQDLEKHAPDTQALTMAGGLGKDLSSESPRDQDELGRVELEKDGQEPDELEALDAFDDDDFDETALDDTDLDGTDLDDTDLDGTDLDDSDLDDSDLHDTDLHDTDLDMSDTRQPSPDVPPARRPARASLIHPPGLEDDTPGPTEAGSKKRAALGTPVLILLLIFILAAGTYVTASILGYRIPFLPEIRIPFIQQHLSQQAPEPLPAPAPVPDQKSVTGRFITNDASGELFIITGNIENPAQIPYRHIQVTGTLFQKEKTAVMSRSAYCGNIVPEDVLKTGNIDDITAQLKIPGGAADINTRVMPGQTVPFMLVFSDLPQNLENFTIEVAGFEKATP